jgi:uncharacterized membrane protein HdeD (DUF308 family)
MLIPWRDRVATLLVAAATLVYVLWSAGPLDGLTADGVALIVLALGFIASASAVVPGFAALIHGSRPYLVITSLVGLVALVAGIITVLQVNRETLTILVTATIGLWAAATARHAIDRARGAVAVG